MTWEQVADEMDRCEFLFLRSMSEETELRLKLVVEEGRAQPGTPAFASELPELQALLRSASRIDSDADCRLFEIIYDSPISYAVLNESYSKYPQAPERFAGKLFRVFTWSHLLDLTRKTTYASDEYPGPGPLQHHEIACQNHVIDVITTKAPEMRVLRKGNVPLVQ